jgi:vacuolar-type H+-ATPase subunit I/STV1
MSFKEKFFKFLDKSVESSKKVFHKAGEKISDFSDKSVMKIELTRMTGKLEKLYASLGEFVFEKRSSAKKTAADTETLKEYYTQIEELLSEIEAKKNAVNSLENESAGTKSESSAETVVEKAKPARAAVRSAAVKSGQKAEQKTSSAGKKQVSKKKTSAASAASAEKTVAVKKSVKRASAKSSAAASASTKKTAERTKKSAAVKSSSKKASD